MSATVTVVGDAEIRQMFLDAGSAVRERIRRALIDLGAEVRDRAVSLAPRKTGSLQKSIRERITESNGRIGVSVRPSALYARFMEFGVVNHGGLHNASRGGLKTRGGRRALVERVRELRASGTYRVKPHPFMEPASDSVRSRVDAVLDAAVAAAIAEVS